jgi:hypothetical protein
MLIWVQLQPHIYIFMHIYIVEFFKKIYNLVTSININQFLYFLIFKNVVCAPKNKNFRLVPI